MAGRLDPLARFPKLFPYARVTLYPRNPLLYLPLEAATFLCPYPFPYPLPLYFTS